VSRVSGAKKQLPENQFSSRQREHRVDSGARDFKAKPSMFELCNHGTILLDEIGEMSPSLQAKLLHVLQDQQFSRLGGRTNIKVDVRIIAATNIDMQEAIAARKFCEDVYYRLAGFTLRIPPLRQRKEEIPHLLKYLMSRWANQYARPEVPLTSELVEACMNYSWPGNIRELENFISDSGACGAGHFGIGLRH
jgi:two-component system, NtrC family, response regulator AtoC